MIDDFVSRPNPPKRRPTGKKSALASDLVPDLSSDASTKPAVEQDESFITPEQAAAKDAKETEIDDVIDMDDRPGSDPKPPKEPGQNRVVEWFGSLNKKKKALVVFLIIFVLAGAGGGVFAMTHSEPPKPVAKKEQPKPKAEPKPTTVANTLTGRQVAPEINTKPVTAVMIENSTDARPQAGLYDAGVVFEAIAEGGITRFLTLWQDTAPENVGPIRSVRPYYLDWAAGFDAPIAHVGGSPEALQRIRSEGIKDLDQSFNAGYYQRVSSKIAPHNVFTSIAKLNELEAAKNFTSSTFTGFARKADAPSKAPDAKSVTLNISSVKYNVSYAYDAATNSYLRNMAGAPHVDANNSKQINPKVVVAMVIPYSIQSDGKHSNYGTIGSGPVTIFQDGTATAGTWAKTSKTSQITFTDAAGKPIALNAGQTWITMVKATGSIVSAP